MVMITHRFKNDARTILEFMGMPEGPKLFQKGARWYFHSFWTVSGPAAQELLAHGDLNLYHSVQASGTNVYRLSDVGMEKARALREANDVCGSLAYSS